MRTGKDNAEEETSDINDTNKEAKDTVGGNLETQNVVLLKNHDGLDLESNAWHNMLLTSEADRETFPRQIMINHL